MMLPGENTFARLCKEELSRVKEREGIGLYKEKRLHSVLKRWICDDLTAHEQKIASRDGKPSRFVADVLTPWGEIAEIQTGSLYPLLKKLTFYLDQTDHPVTVVHPLIAEKTVCWIDPESGELKSRRRSPKHEGLLHAIALLKPLTPLLGRERLRFLFPVLEAEEYRLLDGWGREGKRGSHRYELFATRLLDAPILQTKQDFAALLPSSLPSPFTAKHFGNLTRLSGYPLYHALAVLESLDILHRCGKQGRATLFCTKDA